MAEAEAVAVAEAEAVAEAVAVAEVEAVAEAVAAAEAEAIAVNRRFGLVVVLLVLLGALLVGFGSRFDGTAAYPDAAEIDANYADHVGERVHLWTEVVAVGAGGADGANRADGVDGANGADGANRADGADGADEADSTANVVVAAGGLRLTVTGLDPSAVAVGDRVQVYGELRPGRRIAPARTVVVPAERQQSLYTISAFAVCLAAAAFLRQWRLDRQSRSFVPREEN